MNYLLKQGRIITSVSDFTGDILIENGKIKAVGKNIDIDNPETIILDAHDKYIIPGGLDAHVHLHLITPAGFSDDDFYTGSIAALYGGTTSFIDFVTPAKGESLISALKKRLTDAENAVCDYSFHMSVTSWNEHTAKEMEQCVKEFGITSFKTYMAYKGVIGIDESELAEVMKTAAKLGVLVTVHCELGDEILKRQKEFIRDKKTSPLYHALSRTPEVESESVQHVVELAKQTGCKTYIVHTSTAESVEFIEKAQKKGYKIFSETCPQYLLLDVSNYEKTLPESLKYVISPPLRKVKDQQRLWKGIQEKTISVVATDHCPFNTKRQKDVGINNFTKIPNGAGGIEERMTLLYTYGVLTGKISLQEWVALTSTNPAKIFGVYPQKGEIQAGSDADLVIWNPETECVISATTHHQHCDSNVYEGFKTNGKAEYVFLRGVPIIEQQKIKEHSLIKGSFLKR
jgi:dihydropyrimidinase